MKSPKLIMVLLAVLMLVIAVIMGCAQAAPAAVETVVVEKEVASQPAPTGQLFASDSEDECAGICKTQHDYCVETAGDDPDRIATCEEQYGRCLNYCPACRQCRENLEQHLEIAADNEELLPLCYEQFGQCVALCVDCQDRCSLAIEQCKESESPEVCEAVAQDCFDACDAADPGRCADFEELSLGQEYHAPDRFTPWGGHTAELEDGTAKVIDSRDIGWPFGGKALRVNGRLRFDFSADPVPALSLKIQHTGAAHVTIEINGDAINLSDLTDQPTEIDGVKVSVHDIPGTNARMLIIEGVSDEIDSLAIESNKSDQVVIDDVCRLEQAEDAEPQPDCQEVHQPVDVMLVIDRSGSMYGQLIADAKVAAKDFLSLMDFRQDQAGLVTFSGSASLDQELTSTSGDVRNAITAASAGGSTDIAAGIDKAQAELAGPRHKPGNSPVLILLTDGASDASAARSAADAAKGAGTRIVTIGLGWGVNKTLLQRVASSITDYYFAPSSHDLAAIYEQIANVILCPEAPPIVTPTATPTITPTATDTPTATATAVGTPEARVPKTGQTTSRYTGDDGDLQKGVAWPSPRFTDNGDGTVTDNLTGLIWLKNANCWGRQRDDLAFRRSNALATGQCGLTDGSKAGDWRLPNVRELFSLIDFSQGSTSAPAAPALPSGHPFTEVRIDQPYWSSTHAPGFGGVDSTTWTVDLGGFGDVERAGTFPVFNEYYVWPVRGGQ